MTRPDDLFDRAMEWVDLAGFLHGGGSGMRLGVVSGRRRQGKSFLLRRLVEAHSGQYSLALEEERRPALDRFGRDVAGALGVDAGLRFADWPDAIRAGGGPGRVLVLDEFPYLLRGAPELPSALQALYDETRSGPPFAVILCGSALSVMGELLSGAHPLRGRARLDLTLRPFDFRTTREFWGIDDLEVALRLHAVLGGTPGYRDLTDPPPAGLGELDEWLATNVLNPAHALFGETAYLLREDPRITDRALYQSVLSAIAAGETSPGAIASVLGREARSLGHPLDVLRTAGFVTRSEDLLAQRRPVYTVADPIVRFQMNVVRPRLALYEERRAPEAWAASRAVFTSRVLGPHVEDLARQWTARHASADTLGGPVSVVGQAVLNDPAGRARHEIDVLALADGETPQGRSVRIRAIGEAKATTRPRGAADVRRLEHLRGLLTARGHDAGDARLLLFSRTGFDDDLVTATRRRHDLVLVDLQRLYEGG